MSKTWCPLPWIHQAIRNNGDVRVCCQANTSEDKGIYRKDNGEAYNAGKDDLKESRNSVMAKDIRKSMLAGEWASSCLRCKRETESGVRSRLDYENNNWANFFTLEDAKKCTEEDGSINNEETPIAFYDLRFGNLCNLKCRMCGPTDSSMWYDDQVAVWGVEEFDDSHGKVQLVKNSKGKYETKNNDYGWYKGENVWRHIDENIPSLKRIHTVGGEPMMIEEHYDLLERCIEQGYAKEILVEYNTNLVNIPARAWNIWKHFRRIQIGASIDGIGKVGEYIRYPSKWSQIERNLHQLDNAQGNYDVWISATIQVYNILHLPEFVKWKLCSNFKSLNHVITHTPLITTHPLHNPLFLNVKILPLSTKHMIIDEFDKFYIWLEEWMENENINDEDRNHYRKYAKKLFGGYVDYMMKDDWSNELPKFWKYTKRLDEIRNQSFEETLPELCDSIKDYV